MDDEKKDTGGFQGFGMGNDENEEPKNEEPKINKYQDQHQPAENTPMTPAKPQEPHQPQEPRAVDPSAEPPPDTPEARPAPESRPTTQPLEKQTIGQAKAPEGPKIDKPKKPKGRRKILLGIIVALGLIVAILLIASFIFVSQAGSGPSPIAEAFGLNQASFVNGLITIINFIFFLAALVAFIVGIVGLFKAGMAKKDDKIRRKKNIKTTIISGIAFLLIVIIWVFVFLYLDSKRLFTDDVLPPIVTEPEETLNLTAPIDIRFDASNVPYDRQQFQILSYEWDFGDQETGNSQIVSHTYTEKGRFDILLTIIRRDKETGEEFEDQYGEIVTIGDQALTAAFDADPQSGEAPIEIQFDASESIDPDGKIDRYEWDFDEDGEFDDAEGVTASFEFKKEGKFDVALRVTSTTGDFAILEKEIVIEESQEPEAVITITNEPSSFLQGAQYIFKSEDSSSPNGKILDYEWDFGDGSSSVSTKTATHTFNSPGTYEVTLTITDEDDKEGESSKTIVIGAPQGIPKGVISTDPAGSGGKLSGTAPFTVVFDGSSSSDSDGNIVDYEWDFDGDNSPDGYGALASFTFSNPGTYTSTLTVSDSDGNTGKASVAVTVDARGITANIQADMLEGTVPLTVTFDASGSSYSGGQIVSYEWIFGDGSPPKLGSSKISHKYTSIGSYTASVKVVGADNSSDTKEILITAREIPLLACFSATFDSGPAPLDTTFDPSCSTGTISNYFWDFGDGTTSTSVKPSHAYTNPGTYTVVLEVSDVDNTVSTSQITVTAE